MNTDNDQSSTISMITPLCEHVCIAGFSKTPVLEDVSPYLNCNLKFLFVGIEFFDEVRDLGAIVSGNEEVMPL